MDLALHNPVAEAAMGGEDPELPNLTQNVPVEEVSPAVNLQEEAGVRIYMPKRQRGGHT